jgi:hypothetical protein
MMFIHATHYDQARDVAKDHKLGKREWRYVQDVADFGRPLLPTEDHLLLAPILGANLGVWNARDRLRAEAKVHGVVITEA